VIVLAAIGQLLLFFIFWRLSHYVVTRITRQTGRLTLVSELVVNVVIALILVIIAHTVHSAWWLLIVFGAASGVFTGIAASRTRE
jgi:hypothetical protein